MSLPEPLYIAFITLPIIIMLVLSTYELYYEKGKRSYRDQVLSNLMIFGATMLIIPSIKVGLGFAVLMGYGVCLVYLTTLVIFKPTLLKRKQEKRSNTLTLIMILIGIPTMILLTKIIANS